jgi:hypothetical protein
MDLNKEKKIIDTIRRCQRNWDHSRIISEEHIDHWIYIATHAPAKQDESYFNLYVIKNRQKIDYLLNYTYCHNLEVAPGNMKGLIRNPQMGANVYFLFTSKTPPVNRQIHANGVFYDQTGKDLSEVTMNGHMAIGAASGLVAQSAASLGYKTGFNVCHGQKDSTESEIWKSELGISKDEKITLGLGIGYPQEGRARNEHNETEFLVGPFPSTRHSINDPHVDVDGVRHPIPKIHYNIHSYHLREIKVVKIN